MRGGTYERWNRTLIPQRDGLARWQLLVAAPVIGPAAGHGGHGPGTHDRLHECLYVYARK
jgi:hypothetical protein